MVTATEFFKFSNPLFLDAFVAVVLYIVCRLLEKKFPRISAGIREASLVFIVFMCYDASRYFALDSEALAKANGRKVINFEKDIHIDIEIPMQTFTFAHEDFAKFLNHFYLGAHWGGLVIFFVWAYARVIFASPNKIERRRREYVQARGRFIIMNMIAACSFMAYPCAPPRSFPELGYKDSLLDVGKTDVYTGTRRFVNPYAAMPSMHQGYSLLFATTILIMLRSEILASGVTEPDEEEDDIESGKLEDSNTSSIRSYFNQLKTRYEKYHILSRATRSDAKKLFYISLLPFAFLLYPLFMFVVIVSTGNHFVLDAIAGAIAMGLACLLYPFVLRGIMWVRAHVSKFVTLVLARVSEMVFGVKQDVELEVKDTGKSEEKKGFLEDSTETA
jgi:hypothetical protein